MKIVIAESLSVPDSVLESYKKDFENKGHVFVSYNDRPADEDTVMERCKDADIAVFTNLPFPEEVINNCKNLKMISVGFTGVDHVNIESCKKRGIVVSNASGYSTDSVAELVIAHILMKLRNLLECNEAARNGRTGAGLTGTIFKGKTLGIAGTGLIGTRVAELASVFGCRILGWSRSKRKEALKAGVEYVELESLFSESDIVSVHLPLSDETKGIIDRSLISRMKKNAIFVNAARGAVVDSKALAEALNSGSIKGACIDVFETEPPVDKHHPLLNSKNTVLSPHVAFASKESFLLRAEIVFNNIKSWLENKPVNRVV